MNSGRAALRIDSLTKSFTKKGNRVHAVQKVSFELPEKGAIGIVGENGAGKSTTIKCILGLLNGYSGQISIFGASAKEASSREGVSYVSESALITNTLTPYEVLNLTLSIHGIKANRDQLINHWLAKFQVDTVIHKPIKGFSKGMTQRVALANALISNPRLLILDEPLSGLDPMGRKLVVDILQHYRDGGGTLLFTSHVLHDVERLADDYIIFHKGKVVDSKKVSELNEQSKTVVNYINENGNVVAETIDKEAVWEFLEYIRSSKFELIKVEPELNLESLYYATVEGD